MQFPIQNYIKTRIDKILVILIICVTLIKLNLIGNGFLSFPDENRYIKSGIALKKISESNFKSGITAIFQTKGRPGDAIIKLIPNSLQYISSKILRLDYYESNNSFFLFLFNYIIYIGILILIYKLANHIFKNNTFSLFSVLVYSTLTNSYLYLRHALPYDTSLLIFLTLIYKTIIFLEKPNIKYLNIYYLGFFNFFGYLVYPGYLTLFIVNLIIIFFYKINYNNIKNKFIFILYFTIGSLSCLLIFELISRFTGNSYIESAKHLSSTIKQGSFEETFTFIGKYLIDVEFISGILILVSLPLIFFTVIKDTKDYSNNSIIIILFTSLTALYCLYAGIGYYFHKVVFYGRLLHQFIPFICIFFAFLIYKVTIENKFKVQLIFTLSLICIYSFFIQFRNYLSFSYPKDIAWKYINSMPNAEFITFNEYKNSWLHFPHKINKLSTFSQNNLNAKLQNNKVHVVNCCYFYPVNDASEYIVFKPTAQLKLIEIKNHFLNFKGYQYEGFGEKERSILDSLKFQIKVFLN